MKPLTREWLKEWADPEGDVIVDVERIHALFDRAELADREVGHQMGLRQLALNALAGVKETLATVEKERDEARDWAHSLEASNRALQTALTEACETMENTHVAHCSPAWTDRKLHAPECLLFEADSARTVLAAHAVVTP